MTRKRFFFILIVVLITMSVVPPVFAQSTTIPRQVNFQEVLRQLAPNTSKFGGVGILFDIMLYLIFFLSLITVALIPDKQLFPTLTMVVVLGVSLISKVGVPTIFNQCSFAPLVLNAVMFTFPMIVAGLVRERGRTPRALAPAAFIGLLGGAYFFLYWAAVQSNPTQCPKLG